jgi:NDP-sugar pyrophosphorylase family protein
MIEQALGDGSKFGIRIIYSREPIILGTGGGIKQAEPYFSGEPVVVLNADTLVELDLEALYDFHCTRGAAATLVLREDRDAVRWGLVEVGDDHRILRITGRGRMGPPATLRRMFAGIHIVHPRLLQQVPKGVASSIIDPYVAAIERGEPILGYDLHGYWSDIGTAERYAQAEQDARAGLIRLEDRSSHNSSP